MIRSATFVVIALLTAATYAQQAKPAAPPDKALAPFQGAWSIVSMNGQALADAGAEMSLTFAADKYTQTVNGDVVERGAIKVDAAKKPMAIDLVIAEGSDAGKTQLGVVDITGDTMTLKLTTPGLTERPATLAAQEDQFLFVLKKVK